ncbi:hypothetical protein [Streptosporangium sp. NPDC087985]|uniref:hypothetical protein n=1 Tax=Streptosporangium sp. NPDC087985 TaxID=3366196 RepID=UPI003802EE1B
MTVALTTALTPGMLLFQAIPVTASVRAVTLVQGAPDSPKQLAGSTVGLPSLVSTDATRTDRTSAKRDPKPSKGTLPLESSKEIRPYDLWININYLFDSFVFYTDPQFRM